jgi:hypothetical protein
VENSAARDQDAPATTPGLKPFSGIPPQEAPREKRSKPGIDNF